MVNIEIPQRFYQFKFNNIDTIIDLKIITQISLAHKNDYQGDRITISTNTPEPPIIFELDENKVGSEMYSKLVTAWTTYKLATEK